MEPQLPSRYALDPRDPVLGEGGMGKVFRAVDRIMNIPVAIKVVKPDLAADKRFRRLFDLEVRVAARFTHPHIVPLHDLGELSDGTPFLGLALADAGSFGDLVMKEVAWSEILRLNLELLDALSHLHSRGVLHRDLKPENVLLNRGDDGQTHVWLADLGLANAATTLAKRKGRTEGTPGYMSPEQNMGLPREYGPWTDLYSLGVMLWLTVTGELPFGFHGSPLTQSLPMLIPRDGIAVPEGLDLVMANLLAAEPLSRYDLAADLQVELRALGEPAIDRASALERSGHGVLEGTIAPSAPAPTPPTTSLASPTGSSGSDSVSDGDEGQTFAFATWSPEDDGEGAPAPIWNRPLPHPMPADPPPEPGLGGRARGSLPLFALRELPLVARDPWRTRLWKLAREVRRDGTPRVAVVIGEAGSGKTHLVDSVVRALQEGGWAESVELTYQRPACGEDGYPGAARALIRPWNETRPSLEARLQRTHARDRGIHDEVVREEAALLSRWCGLHAEDEPPVAMGLGLREVYRYLEARTWRGLAVLVLDNAQWAEEDGDGLAIAETVLRTAYDGEERRILCIATVRAEDLLADAALAGRVEALEAEGAVRIDLPRLDRQGMLRLLDECLTLSPELAAIVAERCEGNPLFARQLLMEWTERGWLVDTGGLRFGLAPGVDPDAVLPADAEALLEGRVAALAEASGQPAEFLDAVHLAALAGASMPRDLLEAVVGPELFPALRASGLWEEVGEQMQFSQPLVHAACRAGAEARDDRTRLHARLADAWEAWAEFAGIDTDFEIGRHAHHAGEHERAVEVLLIAAERAWVRGRTGELEEAASLAVESCAVDRAVRDRAGWARLWLARAAEASGDAQLAADRYYQAAAIFDGLDDAAGHVDALVGRAWAARQVGDPDHAQEHLKEALGLARQLGDGDLEARVITGMAWLEQQKRNFDGAGILFNRVLAKFSSIGDTRGVAEALIGQAFVARRIGEFDEAIELYAEAAETFDELEDTQGVARAAFGIGLVHLQRREAEPAEENLREALRIAGELGATQLQMGARLALGDLARDTGDLDKAQQAYEAHLRWAELRGLFEETVQGFMALAHLALLRRDLAGMYERSRDAATRLDRVPGHWLWASCRLLVATYLAMRGEEDKTWRWTWSAQELGLGDTVDTDVAFLLGIIVNVAHQKGWRNPMRVAGKLAMSQYERLGRRAERKRVEALMLEVLGTS